MVNSKCVYLCPAEKVIVPNENARPSDNMNPFSLSIHYKFCCRHCIPTGSGK